MDDSSLFAYDYNIHNCAPRNKLYNTILREAAKKFFSQLRTLAPPNSA